MTSNRNIPATGVIAGLYARGLLDHLRERGVDPARLYPAARVTELDQAQGHVEIPLGEWIGMFETAIDALDDPALPLKAGASLRMRHLGVLGHVLMNSATLQEVAAQLARYIRLLGQIGEPTVSVTGTRVELLWNWPFDTAPDPAVAQFMLGARANFMRWLANRPDLRFDAHLHFPRPADLSAYERVFGGELRFAQAHSKMLFSADYLHLPVVSADEDLRLQFEVEAERALQQLSGESALLRELKRVLMRNLANGRVSIDESAASLKMSPRTLQRRLGEIGLSFRAALEQVRQAQAQALLRDPGVSLTQVAFLLGYTEQSTFHNAFRRWLNCSPGAYRKRQLEP